MKSPFPLLDRRQFLQTSTTAVLASSALFAEQTKIRVKTYVYKKVGDLEIKADVHRPDDNVIRPVVVWIHGGALINGHREGIISQVKELMLGAGYALVSIDYRLAPETKLPGIIEDLEDAFAWIRKEGPDLCQIDPSKIAVMGGSAGGYLTLTSGFRVKPCPTVLVAFWGYGDLVGDWFSQPSPHARHHSIKMTRADALKEVSGPPVSDSRDRKGNGGAFYQHCRQHGIWPKEVSTWDPQTQEENFIPYMPLRQITKDYPPTLLIHGTSDTDVPYEQSVMMQQQFEKQGVPHQLVTIPDAEHGLAGGDPKQVTAAYQSSLEFVNKYMARSQ